MSLRHAFLHIAVLAALLGAQTALRADGMRVDPAFTSWDSVFVYAAFNVHDSNVVSLNNTLTSHPQQDDDIEVYFETDGARKATVRTVNTYEMAVSADNGAYFSEGNGTASPTPKAIFDYKFAAYVDGPINKGGGDQGFTIELAIPWSEFGQPGPPPPGTVWGFNVISRNRDSLDRPAHVVYSLSPAVRSAADIQDPSKWFQITFVDSGVAAHTTDDSIICPRVQGDMPPVIDGTISSGEYSPSSKFSFGAAGFEAEAPTAAQEPNVGDAISSPVAPLPSNPTPTTPGPGIPLPVTPPPAPAQASPAQTPAAPVVIPSGPTITVIPPQKHRQSIATSPNASPFGPAPTPPTMNPLLFLPNNNNPAADVVAPGAPNIDTTVRPPLPDEPKVSSRIMARYVLDQSTATSLDQPESGFGSGFGAGCEQFVESQMRNARLSGIDFLLPAFSGSASDVLALHSLVQTLKTMDANGEDYPLLGLFLSSSDDPYEIIRSFFSIVPPAFRGEVFLPDADGNRRAYVVVADHSVDIDALRQRFEKNFGSRATLAISQTDGSTAIATRTVSPGGLVSGHIIARGQTSAYAASWAKATQSAPDWIVVDSWNDYANGTEVSLSRQYADEYANLTRVNAVQWEGQKPWAAAFLADDVPTEIAQKSLYEVHIRVENTGTLSWRKINGYAISYRWCSKDGTPIDDSAPRIILQDDIQPGESYTATVGVTALNNFGGWIDPGQYYLVFDVVQGNHRWFTYVNNPPLKVPVTVYAPDTPHDNRAVILSTSVPEFVKAGATYNIETRVRNDGVETWTSAGPDLTYSIDGNAPVSVKLKEDATPGAVATVDFAMSIPSDNAPSHTISWKIGDPKWKGQYTETVCNTDVDPQAVFGLTDISRQFKTGQKSLVRISVKNIGSSAWQQSEYKIGYRWSYLDGVPAGPAATPAAALPCAVTPGAEVVVFANVQAPDYAGRYTLTWGIVLPSGRFAADSEAVTRAREILPVQIWVTPNRNSKTVPVDLRGDFTDRAVAFEGEAVPGFDESGAAVPGEMLPPDGSSEMDGDPLLIGRPGPDYYPSGYYSSQSGSGWESNHRISFLYPGKVGKDMVTSSGQTISLPAGNYKSVHILAAAGSQSAIDGVFQLRYEAEGSPVTITIAPWSQAGNGPNATIGLKCPYRLVNASVDERNACVLMDYSLPANHDKRLTGLALPSDPRVKVLAITLEK